MNIIEIILIGISLSMDAFTISICKGLLNNNFKIGLTITTSFAFFQFIMPVIGYYLGNILSSRIINYQSYFSSILLIVLGIIMLKEDKITIFDNKFNYKELFLLSMATSIDALVIGLSFSFNNTNIIISSTIIGIITFIICNIGYYLGKILSKKIHQYANIIGGITLIIIGVKLLF